MLSLFLKQKSVFTDELIVDELIDFYLTASVPSEAATQTIVSHFIKDPESLEEIRKEFDKVREQNDGELEEDLEELVDLDVVLELKYLN